MGFSVISSVNIDNLYFSQHLVDQIIYLVCEYGQKELQDDPSWPGCKRIMNN
jgi:hypothetical protein